MYYWNIKIKQAIKQAVLLTKCYLSYQIKKDEMGRAFSTYKWNTGFWWGNLKERNHLTDLGVDGRMTLMNLQEVGLRMELHISVQTTIWAQLCETAVAFQNKLQWLCVHVLFCTKLTKEFSIQWSLFGKTDSLASYLMVSCSIYFF